MRMKAEKLENCVCLAITLDIERGRVSLSMRTKTDLITV